MPNKSSAVSTVILKRGSLYLSCALYEKYFAGLDAVILLNRDDHLYIMPVRNTSGGGYLLKLKNSSGDRVIIAPDFFREHGLDDFQERGIDVYWDQDMAALKAEALFNTAN
ncbi:MAG: hypothetical protein COA91_13025 [Robiginitomaculum sp.]|nr:MAG: hypothetical protein COA91_13025 [Robiginitomaculum sp.]